MAVTQIDNDKYAIEILLEDEVIINSNLDMSKTGTMKFAIDIEELGKLDLDIEYNEEYDINIDKVDKKKSSTLEELTQKDKHHQYHQYKSYPQGYQNILNPQAHPRRCIKRLPQLQPRRKG